MQQMLNSFKNKISKSHFLRGVFLLAGGTALSQAIGLLAFPVLTRLYTPEAMGSLGLFLSFLGFVAVVGALRYEMAMASVDDDLVSASLFWGSLFLAIWTSLIAGLVFYLFTLKGWLGYSIFPAWMAFLIIPISAVITWGSILRYWHVRAGRFGLISQVGLWQSAGRVLGQIGLAWLPGGTGLLTGEVIGRLLSLRQLWREIPLLPTRHQIAQALKRYRYYPTTQLPSSFLDNLALVALVPVFASLFGVAVGGSLALVQRLLGAPVSLVGGAVADSFHAELVRLKAKASGKARRLLRKTALGLFGLGLPGAFLLGWLGVPMFSLVFGEEWRQAGAMAAAMSPWALAQLAVSPVSRLVFVADRPQFKLLYDLSSVAIVVGVPYLGFRLGWGPVETMQFMGWLGAGSYLLYFWILDRLASDLDRGQ